MKTPCSIINSHRYKKGFSYVEALVATMLIAIALVPMLESLQTGILGSSVNAQLTNQHYYLTNRMEELLSEPFDNLLIASATTADKNIPSSYSDAPGSTDRRLVYLSYYDYDNADADSNPFTILDANTDADNNPYTGTDVTILLLWLRVEIENSTLALETLSANE